MYDSSLPHGRARRRRYWNSPLNYRVIGQPDHYTKERVVFIIAVPRLRGDLIAYFGARAASEHLLEIFCTCASGLYVLTTVETIRRPEMTRDAWMARYPGRIPTDVDLTARIDQHPHEVTTTSDRGTALTLLLTHARQRFDGNPRFCFSQGHTPALRGFSEAPVLPPEVLQQMLPQHPLLWQVGQPLDHLPYRLHRLVPTEQPPVRPQHPARPRQAS